MDDTHALGVFSSSEVAAEALALRHPLIKSRPLNMATAQSKCKARAVCDFLLPYKPRPATSTAPARRLIQWALGSDKKVPAASRAEQERLKAEKEAVRQKLMAKVSRALSKEAVCQTSRDLVKALSKELLKVVSRDSLKKKSNSSLRRSHSKVNLRGSVKGSMHKLTTGVCVGFSRKKVHF